MSATAGPAARRDPGGHPDAATGARPASCPYLLAEDWCLALGPARARSTAVMPCGRPAGADRRPAAAPLPGPRAARQPARPSSDARQRHRQAPASTPASASTRLAGRRTIALTRPIPVLLERRLQRTTRAVDHRAHPPPRRARPRPDHAAGGRARPGRPVRRPGAARDQLGRARARAPAAQAAVSAGSRGRTSSRTRPAPPR